MTKIIKFQPFYKYLYLNNKFFVLIFFVNIIYKYKKYLKKNILSK